MKRIGGYEFSPDESLGSGTFATVYKGREVGSSAAAAGLAVAVKAVDMRRLAQSPNEMRYLESEISIMKALRHPHIVHLLDVIRVCGFFYFLFCFSIIK